MKIEDLTKLGVPEDAAKQIVSMNEAEIAAEQKKLSEKEAELTMASDKIKELTDTVKKFDGVDPDKLKADLEAMTKKYETDTAALKLDNALSLALADSGAIDRDIVKGLLDSSIMKLEDGKLMGMTEQLDKLKKDKAFLFEHEHPEQSQTMDVGFTHGTATSGGGLGFDFTGVRPQETKK